jgi:hypothetical protein
VVVSGFLTMSNMSKKKTAPSSVTPASVAHLLNNNENNVNDATPTTLLVSRAAQGNTEFYNKHYNQLKKEDIDASTLLEMSDDELKFVGADTFGVRNKFRNAARQISLESSNLNPDAPVFCPSTGGRPPLMPSSTGRATTTVANSTYTYAGDSTRQQTLARNTHVNGHHRVEQEQSLLLDDKEDDEENDQALLDGLDKTMFQDHMKKMPANSLTHILQAENYYNKYSRLSQGKKFKEERGNAIAFNTIVHLLSEDSKQLLASSTVATYLKHMQAAMKAYKKVMTKDMKQRVLANISTFEKQAKLDKKNNTQNAHKATTERDVLHLINSAIAEGEGGMYKGLGHVSFYVYVGSLLTS